MNKNERLSKILEILRAEGNASTKYLANILQVSEATIRRDLYKLSLEENLPVKRVHGGVIYSLEKIGLEPMFDIKLSQRVEEKKKLAKLASSLVEDGDTVILDSGTTCYYLAKELAQMKGLKIVTVDVKIAEELARYPSIQTILVGGEVRPGYFSIGGEMATKYLSEIRAEKGFLATDGWDIEGTYNASMFEVGVKRAIIKSSIKTYLIADHTKYGKIAFIKIADLSSFEGIIVDRELPEDVMKILKEKNIKIIF
ncbi:MAG: DeoR family transcriptional regulator [Dictyoglomus sp. NZ13-RE01]|nr:MAG: DeoR family transcriptional regulator [Dictyoglomus sp. NZ13-RE01]